MYTTPPYHRLLLSALVVAMVIPFSASAAVNVNQCLEDATDERTDDLADAYKTYNDLMDRLLNKFGDEESRAYRVTDDAKYRSNTVYFTQSTYTRQIEEANQRLNTTVQNIWSDYYARVEICNGQTYDYRYSPSYTSSSRYQYPNSAYNFVYPQSYSYQYQYTYPYSYQYTYPYQYYPYSYNYYTYPQYDYLIYPYSSNSSYVRRPANYQTDPYASPYYRGRGTCRAIPSLSNPPAGCAYKFYLDEEGCYEYKLRC